MSNQQTDKSKNANQSREDRLKAALKANMGKRKAQARARAHDTNKLAPNKKEKE